MDKQASFPALLSGAWRDLPFEPFAKGVDVHYLWRPEQGPIWAFLRYEAGASVPRHIHRGLETIIVLEGSQSDENGTYLAGTVICNPSETAHQVWSEEGCTILIQWERPVEFID